MKRKYLENQEFIIKNVKRLRKLTKFNKCGDCSKQGTINVGEKAKIKYSYTKSKRLIYELEFEDGLLSDFLSQKEIEKLMGFMD
jgi:hypothetical protein